jgi:hypothetical protein
VREAIGMSFFDCVNEAMSDPEIQANRERGKRAQDMWREKSDIYERQGHPRHIAETLAATDVKDAFRKEAGETRHTFLAEMSNMRKLQRGVESTDNIAKMQTQSVEALDYKARGLVRRFNWKLGSFLKEHHRDLLGRVTKPAQMMNIVRELHGESTGDAAAMALAKGIRSATEDLRLKANELGATIGNLDDWGLPHVHNRRAVTKSGFDNWFNDIREDINWRRIEDKLTGKPFQPEGGDPPSIDTQRKILKEFFDNIAYGKGSLKAIYGMPQGKALSKRLGQERILHFNNADGWVKYNKKYGSGDPYKSLMGHVHKMARDIAAMNEFGPNPALGVDYQRALVDQKTRKLDDTKLADKARGNGAYAVRMMRVQMGGAMPETLAQDYISSFMSSTRNIMTAALLDRAVISSISDLNTMRLAASAIGANPANLVSRHIDLMRSQMSREDALRGGWIADTLADPGIALARFQAEVPPSEVAERLSSGAMRIQGLSHWTDTGRIAFQMEMSGLMASQAGRRLSDVDDPLRSLLIKQGITADDWAKFTNPDHMFTAGNGATFASPIYWREATDLPANVADDIFFKIQSLIEEQTEYAVPTQSLLARGAVDPAAYNIPPGSILYELAKSGTMFKSFAMTFTVNQIRRIQAQPTLGGKIRYGMNLAAGATVMGALSLQLFEMAKGNDPQPMDNGMFWARAAMKGGGFGIIGDIVSAGQSSWGGGFGSYVSGPIPQLMGDTWNLTFKNAYQLATGNDTNFASELATMGKRYTPLGQTPIAGPAIDRMFWDQLQLFLDPESQKAMMSKAKRRENLFGNESWWMPGSPTPTRAPNLGSVFGR